MFRSAFKLKKKKKKENNMNNNNKAFWMGFMILLQPANVSNDSNVSD